MPPTIKQIADLAGVSRGTVDRVLNNRGKVNPATEAKIRDIAEALSYTPNRPGKTLAIKKKQLRFGYILFGNTGGNPFFEDMVAGIRRKAIELEEYGVQVEVCHTPLDDPGQQAAAMDALVARGVHGLAITPIRHPLVEEKISALRALGIPVVTANSDLPHCGRLAYVGADSIKSGETAAGLMARFTRGTARVGIVAGSALVEGHADRIRGFKDRLKAAYPGVQPVAQVFNQDDDIVSFEETRRMLAEHPDIDALFLASAGVKGTCRALEDVQLAGKLTVISFDMVPYTLQMVREGVIAATLGQQPEVQGGKPLDILLDYLGLDIPPRKECFYTKIDIRIAENL